MYGTANLKHISADLVEKIDRALGEAVRRVEADVEATEKVALAFTVGRDKEGEVVVAWQRKAALTVGSSFYPARAGQTQLRLDDVPRSGVKNVTLTSNSAGPNLDRLGQDLRLGRVAGAAAQEDDEEPVAA